MSWIAKWCISDKQYFLIGARHVLFKTLSLKAQEIKKLVCINHTYCTEDMHIYVLCHVQQKNVKKNNNTRHHLNWNTRQNQSIDRMSTTVSKIIVHYVTGKFNCHRLFDNTQSLSQIRRHWSLTLNLVQNMLTNMTAHDDYF